MLSQRTTIGMLVLLLVIAVAGGQNALALLCSLLLVAAGIARLWSRWALIRVSYERSLSQTRAFPDDEVEMTIKIVNRKVLPLASLRVNDRIPTALTLLNTPTLYSGSKQAQLLQRRTSLRWYESVVWRYRIKATTRGAYRLGPVELISGDPFGIFSNDLSLEIPTTLLVYPRLLPLHELGLPATHPLGDMRAPALLRDPMRTIGVRSYAPTDPLKDIHWAATARTGTLQSRVYEQTTARTLAIFLDLDTFEFYYEGIDPEQVERMISATATLARRGLDDGYAVGLYANGAPVEYEHLVRLPAGRSPTQLALIMETLARMTAYSVTTIGRLLNTTGPQLQPGTTIMLISCVNSEATRAALLRQRELGFRATWLYMGDGDPPKVPGVQVIQVRPETAATKSAKVSGN